MKDKANSIDFKRSFAMADRADNAKQEKAILSTFFKNSTVTRADAISDKYGHYDDSVKLPQRDGYGESATIKVDVKRRSRGASKYWRDKSDPELQIEVWGVKPYDGEPKGKIGWTFREDALADYILYVFDSADTDKYFILPYQLLRSISRKNYQRWRDQYGEKENRKQNEAWASSAIYVPSSVVIKEIAESMSGIAIKQQEENKKWERS